MRRLILAVLLALLLLPAASYAKTAEESMLEQARQHFQSGKYYFAVTWLGRILRDFPASPNRKEVLLLMAKAHTLSGRDEKAAPYLRDLLKEFPDAAATLEPGLLKLAKSAEPSPVPLVAKPAAPATAGEKAGIPAAATDAPSTPSPVPALLIAEPAQPIAQPPQPAAAPPSPPIPSEQPAANVSAVQPAPPAARPVPPSPPPPEEAPPSPTPSPPATSPAEESGKASYTLALGETVSQRKLDSLLGKLEAAGAMPVVYVETKKSDVYRLVAGCYGDRKTADRRRAEVSRRHAGAFVVRSDGTFCVVAGSLMSESAAAVEQKRLAGKGLPVKVVKTQVPLTVSRVSTGRFADRSEAEAAAKSLAARGIAATVVKTVE